MSITNSIKNAIQNIQSTSTSDSSTWSQYPASQDVDMGTNNIFNLNHINGVPVCPPVYANQWSIETPNIFKINAGAELILDERPYVITGSGSNLYQISASMNINSIIGDGGASFTGNLQLTFQFYDSATSTIQYRLCGFSDYVSDTLDNTLYNATISGMVIPLNPSDTIRVAITNRTSTDLHINEFNINYIVALSNPIITNLA